MYGHQARPESERNLPEWEREALDRQRALEQQNRARNPAIWQKLSEIERKIDHIFALLVTNGDRGGAT